MVIKKGSNESPSLISRFDKEIKGSLITLLILLIIKQNNKTYGYEIKKFLKELIPMDEFLPDSSLYTILRSLQNRYELIESEQGETKVYYSITPKGEEELNLSIDYWNKIQITANNAISCLLKEKRE